MNKHNIILSVKRSLFRSDDPTSDESNSEFIAVRNEILERDSYTCQYCGFRSLKYQEIHHVNDDHSDNSKENLLTTCCLCHACNHIGLAGIRKKGVLIYLDPDLKISQEELNQMVRVLWIAECSKNREMEMTAVNMLARLYKSNVPAKRKIGTSDPTILGDFLLNLNEENYNSRSIPLNGIYLLPLKEAFAQQISYWKDETFSGLNSNDWVDIANQKLKRWANNDFGDSTPSSIMKILNK